MSIPTIASRRPLRQWPSEIPIDGRPADVHEAVAAYSEWLQKAEVPKLKDTNRKFVDIDRDNFDDVLKSMKPRLAMRVDNTLKDDGSEMAVELNFEKRHLTGGEREGLNLGVEQRLGGG